MDPACTRRYLLMRAEPTNGVFTCARSSSASPSCDHGRASEPCHVRVEKDLTHTWVWVFDGAGVQQQ